MEETNRAVEKYNLAVKKGEELRIEQEMKKQWWELKAGVERMREVLRKRYDIRCPEIDYNIVKLGEVYRN